MKACIWCLLRETSHQQIGGAAPCLSCRRRAVSGSSGGAYSVQLFHNVLACLCSLLQCRSDGLPTAMHMTAAVQAEVVTCISAPIQLKACNVSKKSTACYITCMLTRRHACMHALMHMHSCTCCTENSPMRTCMHAYMHTAADTNSNACLHGRRTYTSIYACSCMHRHTSDSVTHASMQVSKCRHMQIHALHASNDGQMRTGALWRCARPEALRIGQPAGH